MTNHQLAEIFTTIADLLEIKGEVIYKILAYRKAADSLINLGREASEYWKEGKLTEIPGVGKAIAEKIDELLSTGRLDFLEKLEDEVPVSLIGLLKVPDLGPKKVALFWKDLSITNLFELEAAARSGTLRDLPGMGAKSEAKIIAGIEALARRGNRIPLGVAWPFAQELIFYLREVPGVFSAEAAGSLRRMRSTVGDLDLIVASSESKLVMQSFIDQPKVFQVISQGETKCSVEFDNHLRAQLWVHPPERFGTALQYATGSKEHNVRMRELAIKQGLSLSDQSLLRTDGAEILCAEEPEVYSTLGLPWIPPELREDHGEIQAAISNQLPKFIELSDIQAELHTHSQWSDGKLTIKELALEALSRGLRILAITDHSASLGVAGGLSVEEIKAQRQEIDSVQAELGDSIKLLQGCEVEVRADGSLDFPDDELARLDIVLASLHSGLRQPSHQFTDRMLQAIKNPHVDMIVHPTGRLIPEREGADLDLETIFAAASHHQVALEINAHPSRLDLDDVHARRAVQLGVMLAINTDAHIASELDLLFFGVATARRGWVKAEMVINTWSTPSLLQWLKDRRKSR